MTRSALSPPQSDLSPLASTIDKLSTLGLTTVRVWSPAWTRRSWQRFTCKTFPHCDAKEDRNLGIIGIPTYGPCWFPRPPGIILV